MACEYDLRNKVAIVTGAASGIGRATAHLMAESGARLCVADIDGDGADTVARAITQAGGEAFSFRMDVTSEADNMAVVSRVLDVFGQVDIAHLNAGILSPGPLLACDFASWRKVLAVNLDGVFLGIRHAAPAMSRGKGSIVVTASMSGLMGSAGLPAYTASKHGVIGLVKAAAIELGPHIRVNAVCPGAVYTDMMRGAGTIDEVNKTPLARSIVLGRVAEAEEIAHVVCLLASDAASFVTGAAYPVDGGVCASGIPIGTPGKLAGEGANS